MSLDPEAAYYQAIEEFFVSRRGDPLFLSNADWLLVRKWRKAGTPLRIVLRGITDALDSHAHSWGRVRKVGSLAYCAAEVETARERWERALGVGAEEGFDAAGALTKLADTLGRARGLGESSSAIAAALARQLRERAAAPGPLRELEAWLARREAQLLDALRAEGEPDRLERIAATVDAALAGYRERMPARVLRQIRRDAVARRVLEACGLPRLSMFHS